MNGLERIGWLLLAVAVLGSGLILLVSLTGWDLGQVLRQVRNAWFGPPLVALFLAACGVIAMPVAPVVIVSGSLWGWASAPWIAAGMATGVTMGYVLGRAGAGAAARDGGRRLQGLATRHGVLTALLSRWFPGIPFAVQNMSCGALRIGFGSYALGSAVGIGVTATVFLTVGQAGGALAVDAAQVARGAWAAQAALAVAGTVMVVLARRRGRARLSAAT